MEKENKKGNIKLEAGEHIIVLRLHDDYSEEVFTVISKKSEHEIQKEVDKIKREFENDDFEDWTYYDIIDELEERGFIRSIEDDIEYLDIWA